MAGLGVVPGLGLREVPDPLARRPFRPGIFHRVEQLAHEAVRHVHARDDHARNVALLDLVIDAREREGELVVGKADVREVRVDAREVLRIEMNVELTLLVPVHGPTILVAWTSASARAGSASPPAPWRPYSRSERSATAGRWTRAGCRRSTARSSRAPSSASTRCRETTPRGFCRSSWFSQG